MTIILSKLRLPLLWLVSAGLAAFEVISALRRPAHDRLADLHVYIGSVQSLLHGHSLYDFAAANGDPFTYPPFAGLVLIPAALIDETAVRFLWCVGTILAVVALAQVIVSAALRQSAKFCLSLPAVVILLLASAPGSSNIRFGQVSVFLVLIVLADCTDMLPQRLAGVGVGVAAAIKLTPLIFIPYLWATGRRRAAYVSLATFASATLLTVFVLPSESRRYWLTELRSVNRIGDLSLGGNQSINGLLLRLGLDGHLLTVTWLAVIAAVAVAGLIGARRAAGIEKVLTAAAVVGTVSIVVSPVSWTHHQFWTVVACAAILTIETRSATVTAVMLYVVMTIPLAALVGVLPEPLAFLAGNLRAIAAVAVACALGFVAGIRAPVPGNFSPCGAEMRQL